MGFKQEIEKAKKSGQEGVVLQKLSKKARKSFKQQKEDRKKRKVREFLFENFKKNIARAGALVDYFVNARTALSKLLEKGNGFGKAAHEQEGYYSAEESEIFSLAIAYTTREEHEVKRAGRAMSEIVKRDFSLQSSAQHMKSYYEGEVKDSYLRFTKGITPLFLRPKSNMPKSASDKSAYSFGKRLAAAAILSFELTSMYKGAQLDAREKMIDWQMNAPILSGYQEPTISNMPAEAKIILKNPYETEKKEIDAKKKSLDAAGKLLGVFEEKIKGKKTELRLFNEVDVLMGRTDSGDSVRKRFSLSIATKLFDFGGWHVNYS